VSPPRLGTSPDTGTAIGATTGGTRPRAVARAVMLAGDARVLFDNRSSAYRSSAVAIRARRSSSRTWFCANTAWKPTIVSTTAIPRITTAANRRRAPGRAAGVRVGAERARLRAAPARAAGVGGVDRGRLRGGAVAVLDDTGVRTGARGRVRGAVDDAFGAAGVAAGRRRGGGRRVEVVVAELTTW
jgi:hypothetical protein